MFCSRHLCQPPQTSVSTRFNFNFNVYVSLFFLPKFIFLATHFSVSQTFFPCSFIGFSNTIYFNYEMFYAYLFIYYFILKYRIDEYYHAMYSNMRRMYVIMKNKILKKKNKEVAKRSERICRYAPCHHQTGDIT